MGAYTVVGVEVTVSVVCVGTLSDATHDAAINVVGNLRTPENWTCYAADGDHILYLVADTPAKDSGSAVDIVKVSYPLSLPVLIVPNTPISVSNVGHGKEDDSVATKTPLGTISLGVKLRLRPVPLLTTPLV